MAKKLIFKDFSEYWYYARFFSESQREIVFNSLSRDEKHLLEVSCERGGWQDLISRNYIDKAIDDINGKFGYNLIDLRLKVLNGKSIYLPSKTWEDMRKSFSNYTRKDIKFIFGGIKSVKCKQNKDVTLIVRENIEVND